MASGSNNTRGQALVLHPSICVYLHNSYRYPGPLGLEEVRHQLHILLSFLPMRGVARFCKGVPLNPGDCLEERDDGAIGRLIVCAVEQQGRYLYVAGLLDYTPVLQQTGDIEFGRSIPTIEVSPPKTPLPRSYSHCEVDSVIFLHVLEALVQLRWPWPETT